MKFKRIYIVDDDDLVRISLEAVLKAGDFKTTGFDSGASFLESAQDLEPGCVLLDVKMKGMSGIQVLEALQGRNEQLAVIMMSGHGDIAVALSAIRLGAHDFIEKPFSFDTILAALENAYEIHREQFDNKDSEGNDSLNNLSNREREVLKFLAQGDQNKIIARKLGISHRTVEVHRAHIMRKTGAGNFAELVKIAVAADNI